MNEKYLSGKASGRRWRDHDRNRRFNAAGKMTMRTFEALFTALLILMFSSGTVLAQTLPGESFGSTRGEMVESGASPAGTPVPGGESGGPGGESGGPGGESGSPGGESGGPGGESGAPGGQPGGASDQMVHTAPRETGSGEIGIWLVLLVLIVVSILGWKRTSEWGRHHLEPAVDRLHRAARRLDARSHAVRYRAWSPSAGKRDMGLVLGLELMRPGFASLATTAEEGQAERAAIDLLRMPGSAVGLVSDRIDLERIGSLLGDEVSSVQGRLLLSDDTGCLSDGLGSLIGALEGVGAPVSVVIDLCGSMGGVDAMGRIPTLVERLTPWIQRHNVALLLLIPRGPSSEGLRTLGETGPFYRLARLDEGDIVRIEPGV